MGKGTLLHKKINRLRRTKEDMKALGRNTKIKDKKFRGKQKSDAYIKKKLKSYPCNSSPFELALFESFKKHILNTNLLPEKLKEAVKKQNSMSFLHNREILSLEGTYAIADDMVTGAKINVNNNNWNNLEENDKDCLNDLDMRKIYCELGRKIFENSETSALIANKIRIKILEKIFNWSAENSCKYVISHWNDNRSDQENIINAMYYIRFSVFINKITHHKRGI